MVKNKNKKEYEMSGLPIAVIISIVFFMINYMLFFDSFVDKLGVFVSTLFLIVISSIFGFITYDKVFNLEK